MAPHRGGPKRGGGAGTVADSEIEMSIHSADLRRRFRSGTMADSDVEMSVHSAGLRRRFRFGTVLDSTAGDTDIDWEAEEAVGSGKRQATSTMDLDSQPLTESDGPSPEASAPRLAHS
ncbi:hypothetical protein IMZ48_00940 [Candidatus Bathyarchaeota archaeon]|nr:hypothetical protein [Candidatus Bathyarchaeota archaeon]